MFKVAVVMGSASDMSKMSGAVEVLERFGVGHEVRVLSAHRTPDVCRLFASEARENGFAAIIAGAGKAAHLAGAIAANTTLPVIGVPLKSDALDGLDALLSTVQMPKGMPVATVAIDQSANAALLAVQMLSITDGEIAKAYEEYRREMTEKVLQKDAELKGV